MVFTLQCRSWVCIKLVNLLSKYAFPVRVLEFIIYILSGFLFSYPSGVTHAIAMSELDSEVCIEGLRVHVTSSPIETDIKFHVKFTSAWQARFVYKCVPYSSHSYSSSGISVQMGASPLGLYYCYASS